MLCLYFFLFFSEATPKDVNQKTLFVLKNKKSGTEKNLNQRSGYPSVATQ